MNTLTTSRSPCTRYFDLVLAVLRIGSVAFSEVLINARLTATGSLIGVDVLSSKRVPTLAVRLAGVLSGRAVAAQDVHAHCDDLEVIWPHAGTDPAEVVDGHAFGDWTDVDLVGSSVCKDLLRPTQSNAAITSGGRASGPQPMVAALVGMTFQPLLKRKPLSRAPNKRTLPIVITRVIPVAFATLSRTLVFVHREEPSCLVG